MKRVVGVAACSFVVATLAHGCGDDGATATTGTSTTTATGSGGGGGGGCGPVPAQPPLEACRTCTWEKCCGEDQACAADPLCGPSAACVESCAGDGDCWRADCLPLLQQGVSPAMFDLSICMVEQCGAECDVTPICSALGSPDAPDCGACIDAQCCDAVQASNTVDNFRFQKCQLECLDWQCFHDCEVTYGGAVAAQDVVLGCFNGPCVEECAGPTSCGAITFLDATCAECATASCCDPFVECSKTTACLDYFNCYIGCTDLESCTECATLWAPAVAAPVVAAFNCLNDTCTTSCMGSASGCGLADHIDTFACAECTGDSCCSEGTTCGADSDCAALKMCVVLCGADATCKSDCELEFPSAVTAYQALETCRDAACPGDCP